MCRFQAASRARGSATAELHTDSRESSMGKIGGLEMLGNAVAAEGDLSLPRIRAESSNGAGPSGRSPAHVTGTDRPFVNEAFSNGAMSSDSRQNVNSAASGTLGPASGLGGTGEEGSTSEASASSVVIRLKEDLTRQRSTKEIDPAMRSRKEVLRQLRTGETEGLCEAERLRRLRISQANKGRVPWNAGRKHTPGMISAMPKQEFDTSRIDPLELICYSNNSAHA